MTAPPFAQTARQAARGRPTRDAPHARRDIECRHCKEGRTFWALVAPDPSGRAEHRVDVLAMDWLNSHPCRAHGQLRRWGKAAA